MLGEMVSSARRRSIVCMLKTCFVDCGGWTGFRLDYAHRAMTKLLGDSRSRSYVEVSL